MSIVTHKMIHNNNLPDDVPALRILRTTPAAAEDEAKEQKQDTSVTTSAMCWVCFVSERAFIHVYSRFGTFWQVLARLALYTLLHIET